MSTADVTNLLLAAVAAAILLLTGAHMALIWAVGRLRADIATTATGARYAAAERR